MFCISGNFSKKIKNYERFTAVGVRLEQSNSNNPLQTIYYKSLEILISSIRVRGKDDHHSIVCHKRYYWQLMWSSLEKLVCKYQGLNNEEQ